MKNIYKLLIIMSAIAFMTSCNDGIDPITAVDPGPDAGGPTVDLISPADGTQIDIFEMESSIDVEFNKLLFFIWRLLENSRTKNEFLV